jgi:hypothetical protein
MRTTTGIRVRHARSCPGKPCRCQPSFEAFAYDRRTKRKVRKTFPTLAAETGWRADAGSAVRKGGLRAAPAITLRDAWTTWADAAERGEILSRHRRPYKPSALRGYRADMDNYVLPDLGALRWVTSPPTTCRRSSTGSSVPVRPARRCATCSCPARRSIGSIGGS